MGVLAIFQLVTAALGAVPTLIQAAESIFGAVRGQGAVKKDYVQGAVKTALNIAAATGNDDAAKPAVQDAILQATGQAIDGVVGAINAVNAWGQGPKPREGSDR